MQKDKNRRNFIKGISAMSLLPIIPLGSVLNVNYFSNADLKPLLVKNGQGEKANNNATYYTRKIKAENTAGAFSAVEVILKNGFLGAPPHLHQNLEEMMYVLEGSVTVMVGEEIFIVNAGDWHIRPRKLMHAFWNNSGKDAKFIDMYLPGGFEEYLIKICEIYKKYGRVEPAEVDKFAKDYDIEVHFELLGPLLEKYKLNF